MSKTTSLVAQILSEANIADRPGSMARLEAIAADVAELELKAESIAGHWEYSHRYIDFGGMPYYRLVAVEVFNAHRPDGHVSDGSPYWNYTSKRRRVGPWGDPK